MKKRKQKQKYEEMNVTEQNNEFYFIAGYTSGGVPYGVTREEMGLKPWQKDEIHIDDSKEELPFD